MGLDGGARPSLLRLLSALALDTGGGDVLEELDEVDLCANLDGSRTRTDGDGGEPWELGAGA